MRLRRDQASDLDSLGSASYALCSIIGAKYVRLCSEGDGAGAGEGSKKGKGGSKMEGRLEFESHGFAHGALELLFRKTFGIETMVELRSGRGHIDMAVQIKSRGKLLKEAIPIIVEFKRPPGAKSGGGGGSDRDVGIGVAVNQIVETGY